MLVNAGQLLTVAVGRTTQISRFWQHDTRRGTPSWPNLVLEQLGIQVDLDPAFVRKEYLENIRQFLNQLKQTCGELGCDYVPMPTDKSLGEALAHYLKRRTARVKVQ